VQAKMEKIVGEKVRKASKRSSQKVSCEREKAWAEADDLAIGNRAAGIENLGTQQAYK